VLAGDVPAWGLSEGIPGLRSQGPWSEVVVEIGSGMGDATLEMAAREPDRAIVAVDVHTRGIASTVRGAKERGLPNLRVHLGDALDFLDRDAPAESVDAIRVWFPDPWPKSKHAKRRLISPERVAFLVDRLRVGGTLHVVTDIAAYAAVVRECLRSEGRLDLELDGGPRPAWRATTKYERRAATEGRDSLDFIARRSC
jgi:tRNA (guanine-N7-)-methyltransferase